VSQDYRDERIGSLLMELIKEMLVKDNKGYSAFRFVTVDANVMAMI